MYPLPLVPSVTLDAGHFNELLPPQLERAEVVPQPMVTQRTVTLLPAGTERIGIVAAWTVDVLGPGPVALRLAGPNVVVEEVRVDGAVASTVNDEAGTVFVGVLSHDVRIELRGWVGGDVGASVGFELQEAGAGTVEHPPQTVVDGCVRVARGRSLGSSRALVIRPAPALSGSGDRVTGEVGLGVTVGEAEVEVRGRLRWRVTRGVLEQVSFAVPGAGADLEVTGPALAGWTRDGDRVSVTLRSPERALVALDVHWSTLTPTGETGTVPVPAIDLDPVFRTTTSLQIARDPSLDVVPAMPGWEVAAPDLVPDWGQSLIQGAPSASFLGDGGGGTLSVLRFTPADGPATLIDVAAYQVAVDADGSVLMRAHYAVRNDRGAVLRFVAPPGLSPVGVRVGSDAARLSRDGDVWRIPLEKSVETVEGLLTFPIEVVLIGHVDPWSRRDERSFALPVVDAEIAVSRLTMHLPPGWADRSRHGDRVDAFTEGQGITYGFAVGDVRAAEADQLFQSAVDAWMSNEFDAAGDALNQLDAIGASSADIGRLRSNLALLDDTRDTTTEDVAARRVLEQARVRAAADAAEQQAQVMEAEEAYQRGEYAEAEKKYKAALSLGEDLAKLSNEEDKRQEYLNSRVAAGLSSSSAVSQQKAAASSANREAAAARRSGDEPAPPPPYDVMDFEFSDEVVEGELVRPDADEEWVTVDGAERQEVVGVEGGVAGGVVGGVVLGLPEEPAKPVVVDPASTTTGVVVTKDFLEKIPAGRSYESAVELEQPRTGRRAPVNGPAAAVVEPPPEVVVTASSVDVVVPSVGATVLYQHLLLPSDTAWVVSLQAKQRRGSR